MSVVKAHRFPVALHWEGGRLTRAGIAGKPELEIATPPEFKDGIPGVWSPEDLLVASAASCFAVTLVAVAEAREVPLLGLDVNGTGYVSKHEDGRFGFIAVELEARITTATGFEAKMERAAHAAEKGCLVARALEVPVHLVCEIAAEALVS